MPLSVFGILIHRAGVAELADALGLGPSERKLVGVQVPSPAPESRYFYNTRRGMGTVKVPSEAIIQFKISFRTGKLLLDRALSYLLTYPKVSI